MNNLIDARSFRVFISSTFRDMHDERDYLNQVVFPEIRAVCRERCVTFTPIDLRWGISDEESSRGDTLRICLDEVHNSNPFFIGLLGERYGWIPEQQHAGMSLDELEQSYNGLVAQALKQKKSITEMEIQLGVLENDQKPDAYFYFKGNSENDTTGKLLDLKQNIRQWAKAVQALDNTSRLMDGYLSVEEMGEQIKQDMLRVLDKRWPADSIPTKVEMQRNKHHGFSHSRREGYIPNEKLLQQLDKFIANPSSALGIVSGDSGVGKSSLLAEWAHNLQKNNLKAWVFEHYIGAFGSTSGLDIIHRLLDELDTAFSINVEQDEKRPLVPYELCKYLNTKLAQLRKPVVIVLDALDQLEKDSLDLRWLPVELPSNVHIVVSTLCANKSCASLGKLWKYLSGDDINPREHRLFQVEPFEQLNKMDLIDSFSRQYRKNLSSEHINKIVSSPLSSNPLFLKNVLDEVRLHGRFNSTTGQGVSQEISELLDGYLNVECINSFFELVIANRESYFGRGVVERILSLLYSANNGLSEVELLKLLNENEQSPKIELREIIAVLRSFEAHLTNRQQNASSYQFFHAYIKNAITERYKLSGNVVYHQQIANFFSGQEMSDRKLEELPWQLIQLQRWEQLEQMLLSSELVDQIYKQNSPEQKLLGYWLTIPKTTNEDVGQKYLDAAMFTQFETPGQIESTIAFRIKVISFLREIGCLKECSLLCTLQIAHCQQLNVDNGGRTLKTLLIDVERQQGNFDESAQVGKELLADLKLENELGTSLYRDVLNNLALVLMEQDKLAEAEQMLAELLEMDIELLGSESPDSLNTSNNLLQVFQRQGKLECARDGYQALLSTKSRVLGDEHSWTLDTKMNLAAVLFKLGEGEKALSMIEQVYLVRKVTYGELHPLTLHAQKSMTICQAQINELTEPLYSFNQLYKSCASVFGEQHPEVLEIKASIWIQKVKLQLDFPLAEEFADLLAEYCEILGAHHTKTAELTEQFVKYLQDKSVDGPTREILASIVADYEVRVPQAGSERLELWFLKAVSYAQLREFRAAYYDFSQLATEQEEVLGLNNDKTLRTLHWNAFVAEALGDRDHAIAILRKQLPHRERLLGLDHESVMASRLNLIHSLEKNEQFIEAVEYIQVAKEIKISQLGRLHKDVLSLDNMMADNLRKAHQFERAIEVLKDSLAAMEGSTEIDKGTIRILKGNIATTYTQCDMLPQAAELFNQLINEQLHELGEEHLETIETQAELAYLYYSSGDLPQAIALYKQFIPAEQKAKGIDAVHTLQSMSYLGLALFHNEDLEEAKDQFEKVLELEIKKGGENSKGTAAVKNNLATLLVHQGVNLERAKDLFEDVIKVRTRLFGEYDSSVFAVKSKLQSLNKALAERGHNKLTRNIEEYNHLRSELSAYHLRPMICGYELAEALLSEGELVQAAQIILEQIQMEVTHLEVFGKKHEALVDVRTQPLLKMLKGIVEYSSNANEVLTLISGCLRKLGELDLELQVHLICNDFYVEELKNNPLSTTYQAYFENRNRISQCLIDTDNIGMLFNYAAETHLQITPVFEGYPDEFSSNYIWALIYSAIAMIKSVGPELAQSYLIEARAIAARYGFNEELAKVNELMDGKEPYV